MKSFLLLLSTTAFSILWNMVKVEALYFFFPIAHGIYFSVKGIRKYMRSIVSARQINPVSKSGFPVMARAIDCIGANRST